MTYIVKKGTTSKRILVHIQDMTQPDGSGLAGLVFNSSGLTCYYAREDQGNAGESAVTLATATLGTWTSSGFKEKDATNAPGDYEFGVPDAVLTTGATWATLTFRGAANMVPCKVLILLTAVDLDDAVRFGLTTLPNAAAEAAGGLYTRGTGAGQINQEANGYISVNLKAILGTVLTETAGLLAGGFKKFFNVAAPTGTLLSIPDAVPDAAGGLPVTGNRLTAIPTVAAVTTVTNLTNAPTSGDLTATMKTSVTTAATAATPIAASVTGAVGSVAGNVVGSVGSVVGAVGSVAGNVGGSVASVTVVSDKTGYALSAAYDAAKTAAQVADVPTANANADALLDRANAIETGWTIRKAVRIMAAALGGKASGLDANAPVYRDLTDAKNRITATTDANGNRSAVTLDGT